MPAQILWPRQTLFQVPQMLVQASRGFEPQSLDSESRVLTATDRRSEIGHRIRDSMSRSGCLTCQRP